MDRASAASTRLSVAGRWLIFSATANGLEHGKCDENMKQRQCSQNDGKHQFVARGREDCHGVATRRYLLTNSFFTTALFTIKYVCAATQQSTRRANMISEHDLQHAERIWSQRARQSQAPCKRMGMCVSKFIECLSKLWETI